METEIKEPFARFVGWRALPRRNLLVAEGAADGTMGGSVEVRVTPKAMDVLAYLLRRPGQVVSKDELLGALWPDVSVSDDALVVTIYELRKALGDKARQPTYLETVARRGYRFKPEVEWVDAPLTPANDDLPGPPSPPPVGGGSVAGLGVAADRPAPRWLKHPVALGLLFLLLSASAVTVLRVRTAPAAGWGSEVEVSVDDPVVTALLDSGMQGLELRFSESLDRAEESFRRLRELRPEDARAAAGLARVASFRADQRLGDRLDLYHQTRSFAEQALALDAEEAHAHLALATVELFLEWDQAAAQRRAERVMRRVPDDPDVLQVLAWSHSVAGRHREALRLGRRGVELQPASPIRRADLAFLLVMAGENEDAATVAADALRLQPGNGTARAALVRACLATGDEQRAADGVLEGLRHQETAPSVLQELEDIQAREGYWAMVASILDDLPTDRWLTTRAAVHARRGQTERALGYLEQAFQRRDWEILWLEQLVELEPLRREKRFRDLIRRRGQISGG